MGGAGFRPSTVEAIDSLDHGIYWHMITGVSLNMPSHVKVREILNGIRRIVAGWVQGSENIFSGMVYRKDE